MFLWSTLLFSSLVLSNPLTFDKRDQCAEVLSVAQGVASRLQTHYYDPTTGMYNGGSLWFIYLISYPYSSLNPIRTDANTLEDLHNLMLATGTDQFSTVADSSYIGKSALNPDTNWQNVLGGANDDALVGAIPSVRHF